MGAGRKTVTFHGRGYGQSQTSKKNNYSNFLRGLSRNDLGGIISGCTNATMNECLEKKLFGLPATHFDYVKHVRVGMPLFLFNYSTRTLFGVFTAESNGRMNIDPYAWTNDSSARTRFPAQVQVCTEIQYKSISEREFKPVIAGNYYTDFHFFFELDHDQVGSLLSLFEAPGFKGRGFSDVDKWGEHEWKNELQKGVDHESNWGYGRSDGGWCSSSGTPSEEVNAHLSGDFEGNGFQGGVVSENGSAISEHAKKLDQPLGSTHGEEAFTSSAYENPSSLQIDQVCKGSSLSWADDDVGDTFNNDDVLMLKQKGVDDESNWGYGWSDDTWCNAAEPPSEEVHTYPSRNLSGNGFSHGVVSESSSAVSEHAEKLDQTLDSTQGKPSTSSTSEKPSSLQLDQIVKGSSLEEDDNLRGSFDNDEVIVLKQKGVHDASNEVDGWSDDRWCNSFEPPTEEVNNYPSSDFAGNGFSDGVVSEDSSVVSEHVEKLHQPLGSVQGEEASPSSASENSRWSNSFEPPSEEVNTYPSGNFAGNGFSEGVVAEKVSVISDHNEKLDLPLDSTQGEEASTSSFSEKLSSLHLDRVSVSSFLGGDESLRGTFNNDEVLVLKQKMLEQDSRIISLEEKLVQSRKNIEQLVDQAHNDEVPVLKQKVLEQDNRIISLEEKLVHSGKTIEQLVDQVHVLTTTLTSLSEHLPWRQNVDLRERILLLGGRVGNSFLPNLDGYSPSRDNMIPLAPMHSLRLFPATACLSSNLYVMGGSDFTSSRYFATVESYNPDSNSWSICPSLTCRKGYTAAAALQGKLFVLGGRVEGNGNKPVPDVEMYDPIVGKWMIIGSLLQERHSHSAVEFNGAIYVAGGHDQMGYLQTVERFDPREARSFRLSDMLAMRGGHCLTVLNNNIYAVGGCDAENYLSSVELFDPRIGAWVMAAAMNISRGCAAAAVLGDSLYAIGGVSWMGGDPLDSVERLKEGGGWEYIRSICLGKRDMHSAAVMQVDR